MIKQEDVFKIGRFAKTHGVKGELSLLASSDLFDASEDPYVVCDIDGILVPFFIESYRDKSSSVILMKLECVETEEAAQEFVNLDVFYPLEEVDENDLIGDITWDSFVGFTVLSERHGVIGTVTEVDESTINVLFHIESEGGSILFPIAEELVSGIDHSNKQITVIVPEGLLEL